MKIDYEHLYRQETVDFDDPIASETYAYFRHQGPTAIKEGRDEATRFVDDLVDGLYIVRVLDQEVDNFSFTGPPLKPAFTQPPKENGPDWESNGNFDLFKYELSGDHGDFKAPSGKWKTPTVDNESFEKIRHEGRIKMTNYRTGSYRFSDDLWPLWATVSRYSFHDQYPSVAVFIGIFRKRLLNIADLEIEEHENIDSDDPHFGDKRYYLYLDDEMGSVFKTDYNQSVEDFISEFYVDVVKVLFVESTSLRLTYYAGAIDPFKVPKTKAINPDSVSLRTLELFGPPTKPNGSELLDPIHRALANAKTAVVSDLTRKYEPLIDLLEGRTTFKMVAEMIRDLKKPLKALDRARKNGLTKEASSRWLQFRYGIMPVIYSIQDILELYDELSHQFQTVRRRQVLPFNLRRSLEPVYEPVTGQFLPGVPEGAFYFDRSGQVVINTTGKAKFASRSSRALRRSNLNLLSSVWDIVPYSLVVDWFSNTSEYLHAITRDLSNFLDQEVYCYSIRLTLVEHFRRHSLVNGRSEPTIFYTYEEESYHRETFQPKDVELVFFNKFKNWKRHLDAAALSFNALSTFFKNKR